MVILRRLESTTGWEWEQDELFWQKVSKGDDCWIWTGAKNRDGYGLGVAHTEPFRAHRRSWEMATGESLTEHDTICHTCDVPACVRSDEIGTYRVGANEYPRRGHLYKATQPANVADRDAKQRGNWATGDNHGTHTKPESLRRGSVHSNARLNEEAVCQIRATYTGKYGELAAMARRFGVSTTTIQRAVIDSTWQHVNGTGETLLLEPPRPKARGAGHSQARLTEAQVLEIRARVASGERQRALAAEYGMSTTMLSLIVNRKAWTHI